MLLDRAVINSGPLVALSLAGRLDLLPSLFAEFWIPEPVFREVTVAGVGRPGAGALADTRWAPHVRPSPTPDPLLIAELDPGEAAVIALARSVTPCLGSVLIQATVAKGANRAQCKARPTRLGRPPTRRKQRRNAPDSPPSLRVAPQSGVCGVVGLGNGTTIACTLRLASIRIGTQRDPPTE